MVMPRSLVQSGFDTQQAVEDPEKFSLDNVVEETETEEVDDERFGEDSEQGAESGSQGDGSEDSGSSGSTTVKSRRKS